MNENAENNKNQEQSIQELREHLSDGGFGSDEYNAAETPIDQTPDEAVVDEFLSQFGVEGDTALKAHDWKAYIPSSICKPSFWGPIFGIIREETESIYVFDSKLYEKDEYIIGYVDDGSYLSQIVMKSINFSHGHYYVVGIHNKETLALNLCVNEYYTSEATSDAIAALREQLTGITTTIDTTPSANTSALQHNSVFKPVDHTVVAAVDIPMDPMSHFSLESGSGIKPVEKIPFATNNSRHAHSVRVKQYDTVTNLFSRNTGLLESSIMLDKRAVLVGCGSVGSFVAMELARSGVGKFVLCDTDTLEIHNICRHQCGYSDLGRYKVDAVKDKILNINPNAEVITYRTTIQRVPENELLPLMGRDTIIIGGGDNRASADWACKLAIRTDSTFVATCCWTRAFAGEIFYWASGRNLSCYTCALGGLIDEERPESHATYFGSDEEKEKLSFEPGVAVDIDFVTIIAVKLALDLLNRDNPNYTPRVIDNLRQYTWVCNTNSTRIGGERAGIFSYPLQITRNLTVHKDNNCPFCGGK